VKWLWVLRPATCEAYWEFAGTEGSGCKCMHLLEVVCFIVQFAHFFAPGGLTCFVGKKFLKVDAGDSLAWEQATSLLTATYCSPRGSFPDYFIKSELHRLHPSSAAHPSRDCSGAYDWCQYTV